MHILLATDGSPNGNAGADLLTSFEAPPDVDVTVLVAVPDLPVPGSVLAAPDGVDERDAAAIAGAIAGQVAERLRNGGYEAREVVRSGSPGQVIIDAAQESQPEFVVLGTEGVSRLRRLLVGSVATDVARRATVPVLLTVDPVSFESVIVVSDNSPRSMQSVEALRRIPPSMLSRVVFLMINPSGPVGDTTRRAFEDAAEALQRAGVETVHVEQQGNEVDVVLNAAWMDEASVIIVPASGEHVDGEPVLGTTAHGILERAPCSMVIAR